MHLRLKSQLYAEDSGSGFHAAARKKGAFIAQCTGVFVGWTFSTESAQAAVQRWLRNQGRFIPLEGNDLTVLGADLLIRRAVQLVIFDQLLQQGVALVTEKPLLLRCGQGCGLRRGKSRPAQGGRPGR